MKIFILLIFTVFNSCTPALADNPPPGSVFIKGGTDGTHVGNVGDAMKVNVTNGSGGGTVTQGPSNGGSDPWYVQGALGRTWNLSSGSDSVTAMQGAAPWTFDLTKILGAAPSVTNYLPSRITNGTSFVDPTQIRSLSSISDSVTTVPSGTQTVTVSSGTIVVTQPTGTQLHTVTDSGSVTSATVTNPSTNYSLETGGHLASIDSKFTNPLPVSGSVTTTNSANGNTGTAVPAQATQVAGKSGGGNLVAIAVSSAGVVTVDGSASTQPISGSVSVSNFPATQPVSGTVTANAGTNLNTSLLALESGGHLASIDTKLTSPLAVTGTFFQATQPVSSTQLPAALDGSGFLKVHEQGTSTISGTVTANAGTNLNTSALALDSTVAKDSSLSTLNTSVNTLLKPASTLTAVTTVGTITNPVLTKSPINPTGNYAEITNLTTSAQTFTAPANSVGFVIETLSDNTNNVRYKVGAAATTTSGMRLEPGRSETYAGGPAANISVIAEGGTNQVVSVQWTVNQ